MSGITVSYGNTDEDDLKKMLSKLKHRGNKTGIKNLGKVTLGYRGMSLEKLADHSLNSFTTKGNSSVVLDGFVYTKDGKEDSVNDSCKRIVEEFDDHGENFVKDLEGSFAVAATDGEELFIARDPFGIKPLYYGSKDDNIYFTSEIKALVQVTDDINVFPPGHYYLSNKGFKKYDTANDNQNNEDEYDEAGEAAGELKNLLIEAVDRRAYKGEQAGILLSGGLDSSIVAAAANHIYEKVETFSVGAEGSPDIEAARVVAESLGTEHYEHMYSIEDILKILPKVIYHLESYDAPLVQSAIANYFASRMASENGCQTILCGEGADELFAGYHYIKDFDTEEEVEKELEKIISIGHSMGFQRVDRMNSAHSLESHVPFMDQYVVDFANSLSLEWKLYGKDKVEKWILRKAFDSELPDEVVWRRKEQFSHGTGCNEVMGRYADEHISDEEFEKEKVISQDRILRSKEELMYYRIFKEFFPQESVIDSVTLWSDY